MKKLLMVCSACVCLLAATTVSAANTSSSNATTEQKPLWEISMMPKPSAEQIEAARWSLILENEIGVYAYDMDSLNYAEDTNGKQDKNIVDVEVKTVFTNKDILKSLQKNYATKLEKKEKVSYVKMDMQFNMTDKSYRVAQMNVYTDKDRQIDEKRNEKFSAIPEKSFGEAMFEICQQYVLNEQSVQ